MNDEMVNRSTMDGVLSAFPQYGLMHSVVLDAYVSVGDFIMVERPTGDRMVGKNIDVSKIDDININKLSLADEDYFFLDNSSGLKKCGLIQIWKKQESETPRYTQLTAEDRYKLRGLSKLLQTHNAMWFGTFNIVDLAFVFHPQELKSGRPPH